MKEIEKTYHIETLADILAVPPEHIDELLEDIKQVYEVTQPLTAPIVAFLGHDKLPEMLKGTSFKFFPDGKHEMRSMTVTVRNPNVKS